MNRMKVFVLWTLAVVACWAMLTSCTISEILAIQTPTPTQIPTPTITPTPSPTPTPTPVVLPRLQLNLKEGDFFRMRIVIDQDISSTVEGQQENILQKMGFIYTYTVTNVDVEGNVSIDIVYDWVLMEQESASGKVVFDSSNPPEEIPTEAIGYSALLGRGFSMKMTSRGEVLEIEGINEMYSEILDNLGITDVIEREQMEQFIHDQFGEEAIKEQCKNIVLDYPEGPIQIGDTWISTAETSMLISMIIENTYTLREYDGEIATIDVSSIITSNPEAEMLDFGYVKIGYSLSGEQEGVIMVDVEKGMTFSSMITQTLSGDMNMVIGDEEVTVPMSILGTVSVEMIKEK